MKDVVILGQLADAAMPAPEEVIGSGKSMANCALVKMFDFLSAQRDVDKIIISHPLGSQSASNLLDMRPRIEPYPVAGEADYVLTVQYALARRNAANNLLVIDQYYEGDLDVLRDALSRDDGAVYFDSSKPTGTLRTSSDVIYIDVDASQAARCISRTGKMKASPRGILYQTAGVYTIARKGVVEIFDALQRASNNSLSATPHDALSRLVSNAAQAGMAFSAVDVGSGKASVSGSEKLKAIFNL